MSAGRRCDGCEACCQTLPVEELRKPGGARCPAQTGSGCQVYALRPAGCQAFRCLWLLGQFEEEDRPDKVGAVFVGKGVEVEGRGLLRYVQVWIEAEAGELSKRAQELLALAGRDHAVELVQETDPKTNRRRSFLLGHPQEVELLVPFLRESRLPLVRRKKTGEA